ncbi:DNA-methyltransferase [Flexivirga caeni]|uniref:Methyltransferase n=1 Tax=Flexivirga caeni TaxID=2294115 RepID=A0A3M9LUN0_9MICO|nr:site-specific DNA-methyltransferase [Flexivirga caeni]RNI17020.1 site-specific DNA-methyltransferase [Flexivirga caeni]
MIRNQILLGDALQRLRQLESDSIDTVVTSPPYFRLRNYGVAGQLGAEAHVDQWVEQLRAIASEIRRVLVPTGTLWLNLGDTYSTHRSQGAERKSLLAAPERLLLALLADGWICRNKIVWAKTNPTPSSVRDRLSTTHETIYLLATQPSYYFALDAIREPHRSQGSKRPKHRQTSRRPPASATPTRPIWLGSNTDSDGGLKAMHQAGIVGHPLGKNPGDVWRMSVSSYRGAHFATYPEHLAIRMLEAGCPESRCRKCRKPWNRRLDRHGQAARRLPLAPTCRCEHAEEYSQPGIVLDPFIGSGTTAIAAETLGRAWLGIELNPEYISLARRRIQRSRQARERPPPGDSANK